MELSSAAASRRWFVAAVCFLSLPLFYPIFSAFYAPAGHGLDVTGHPIGRDFINFWAAPRIAFSADASALFDIARYNGLLASSFGQPLPPHWWSYPPVVLPLLWPLKHLSYLSALALWTAAGFALYAWAVLKTLQPEHRQIGLVFLLLAPSTLITVVGGQNGLFTGALFVAGVSLIERRPILAGVMLGLLTVKPHLGAALPLALVALAAWRTIASAVVTCGLLYASSVLILGNSVWEDYLTTTVPIQLEWMKSFHGFFTSMLVSVASSALHLGMAFDAAMRVQMIAFVCVAFASAWAVRQTEDGNLRMLILASATPLATPWCFNYDLPLVTAAWLAFVLRTGQGWLIGALVCLVPILVMRVSAIPLLSQAMLLAGFVFAVRLTQPGTWTIRSLINLRHISASDRGPHGCSSPTTR